MAGSHDPQQSRNSATDFAALFDRASDGVVILDDEGRYVDANPAACAMNGVERAQVLGMRIGAGSGAFGSAEQFARVWQGFLRDGELAGELRLHRGDGSVRDIEYRVTASFVPHRHLAILRDVTDRKRSERRLAAQYAVTHILAESESLAAAAPRLLRAICACLECTVGDLWSVDPGAGVMRCIEIWHDGNAGIPDFTQATRALTLEHGRGLPGRVWASARTVWIADVTTDPDFPRAEAAARENLHGAFAFPVMAGGRVMAVLEFFSSLIRPPDDDVVQLLSVIGSQIGQFLERKLAQESVREADRRKDEFLAMLAHELRNPLAPIRNAVEVVSLLSGDNAEVRRASDIVARQVDHMTRLIDDLLDVSRITRGAITLRRSRIPLQAVLTRALEISAPLLSARGHDVEVRVPDDPVHVDADAVRLEQVVANLLNNAAKYTESGGRITVQVEVEGDQVVVRVRDNGIGISREMLPIVFDLFAQADRSLERTQSGLGIGLTLVRALVELHGGSVHALSEGLGQGSELIVKLPLRAPQ